MKIRLKQKFSPCKASDILIRFTDSEKPKMLSSRMQFDDFVNVHDTGQSTSTTNFSKKHHILQNTHNL